MTFITNPTITDVTQISKNMADMQALSMTIAVALLGLVIPLEMLRQNIKAIEDQSQYSSVFTRAMLSCIGLILYRHLFDYLVEIGFVVENAILSIPKWQDFLMELSKFYASYRPALVTSTFPIIFAWLSSFLALVIKAIIYWVRYALLSVLYFVGPISIVLFIFEPTKHLLGSWFKNVLQISLWTVVLRLLIRIMLELQVKTFLAQANVDSDVITIIGINVTYLVMLVCSPLFTAQFISDHTIGPVAVMAASFFAAPTTILAKAHPVALTKSAFGGINAGRKAYRSWQFGREIRKTEQEKQNKKVTGKKES